MAAAEDDIQRKNSLKLLNARATRIDAPFTISVEFGLATANLYIRVGSGGGERVFEQFYREGWRTTGALWENPIHS